MNIILFENHEVDQQNNIVLKFDEPRAKHIVKILKAHEGDKLDAGIISGYSGKAVIQKIKDSGISLFFDPQYKPEDLYPITILLGLSRPPTVKKVLKEATALGVKRFILCGTENGEKSYRESSLFSAENIRKVLIEGAQQARCTTLPEVEFHFSLKKGLEHIFTQKSAQIPGGTADCSIALDNIAAEKSITEYWKKTETEDRCKNIILAAGSERGWTESERRLLKEKGFILCSMGSRVLRTETAAISGTAICLSGMGLI